MYVYFRIPETTLSHAVIGEARLAINDASGQVIVLSIKQTLNTLGSPTSLSRQHAVDVEVASEKVTVTGALAVFGELSWISAPSRQVIARFPLTTSKRLIGPP